MLGQTQDTVTEEDLPVGSAWIEIPVAMAVLWSVAGSLWSVVDTLSDSVFPS